MRMEDWGEAATFQGASKMARWHQTYQKLRCSEEGSPSRVQREHSPIDSDFRLLASRSRR